MPGLIQWRHASEPKNIVGYFHWPLLANVALATAMLTAYGGSRWCTDMIHRWGGTSASSLTQLASNDALTIYGSFFSSPSVIEASCKDYEAGAFLDIEREKEDQEQGRKVDVPVLLVWSEEYLGGRYGDVVGWWREWIGEGVDVVGKAIRGSGHFVVEEEPGQVADIVKEWLGGLGSGS
jgi:pimeloyl-ACP methyl ester carboxylesterase